MAVKDGGLEVVLKWSYKRWSNTFMVFSSDGREKRSRDAKVNCASGHDGRGRNRCLDGEGMLI